jgi:hypothetical protein
VDGEKAARTKLQFLALARRSRLGFRRAQAGYRDLLEIRDEPPPESSWVGPFGFSPFSNFMGLSVETVLDFFYFGTKTLSWIEYFLYFLAIFFAKGVYE